MDCITEFSDDLFRYDNAYFGHEKPQFERNVKFEKGDFHRVILSTYSMSSNRHLKPLSGSATLSVEKDGEGNTTAEVAVTASSDDGKVEVSVSGSVDQDGNTSGKIGATINWKNEN